MTEAISRRKLSGFPVADTPRIEHLIILAERGTRETRLLDIRSMLMLEQEIRYAPAEVVVA